MCVGDRNVAPKVQLWVISLGLDMTNFLCDLSSESSAAEQLTQMCACARNFGSKVKLWATFNEPGVMGFCGWIYGTFPPARIAQLTVAGLHMCNMLRAHTAAYKAIKALPGMQACPVSYLVGSVCDLFHVAMLLWLSAQRL